MEREERLRASLVKTRSRKEKTRPNLLRTTHVFFFLLEAETAIVCNRELERASEVPDEKKDRASNREEKKMSPFCPKGRERETAICVFSFFFRR